MLTDFSNAYTAILYEQKLQDLKKSSDSFVLYSPRNQDSQNNFYFPFRLWFIFKTTKMTTWC